MFVVRSMAVLALAGSVLAACGSSDVTTGVNTGVNTNCSLTLSGAQTGTFNCTAAAAYNAAQDSAGAGVSATTSSPVISLAVGRRGQWSAGTFKNTDTGALGAVVVSLGTQAWMASSPAANGGTAVGSYTLVLTSANGTSVSGGTVYTIHGTFDATLNAVTGSTATGTITIHSSF